MYVYVVCTCGCVHSCIGSFHTHVLGSANQNGEVGEVCCAALGVCRVLRLLFDAVI